MTTMTSAVTVEAYSPQHFPSGSGDFSPSENWDEDFEFQAQEDSRVIANASEAIHASGSNTQFEEGEESWDDAYADDDGPSSPPRRVPKAHVDEDEEIEDWDSSDNDVEDIKSFSAHGYNGGTFEEEDRTVTARSTASSRFRSPPPPLPPPAAHTTLNKSPSDAVVPLSVGSPTLSTFSIPPSSNLDHSVYSNEGLIRGSSNSVPHLNVLRSYPNGAGTTPPRKGRRLRKKSRPPEADIIELEDRSPVAAPVQSACSTNRLTALPQPPSTPEMFSHSSHLPSSPNSPSLLTRIGSFKRWTRRSIGPEDTSLAGWRRAKSSSGPSDVTASAFPVQRKNADFAVENIRSTSPPAPPVKNRNRGSSASGVKSGWFFRSGGAADNETIAVPPKQIPPTNSSSPISPQAEAAVGLNDPTERETFTPTPRKSKGRLVPVLKSPMKKKHDSSTEPLSEPFGTPPPPPYTRPQSSLSNTSKYGFQFPRYSASVGRNTGSNLSAELSEKEKGTSKDKDGGMKNLVKGVRRLSQVGISGHKRAKSTGKTNDESKAKPVIEVLPPPTSSKAISTLLPPVELNSPILPTTIFSRRGSLPRTEFTYVLPINGHEQPAYSFSPNLPLENSLSMERMSFSSSRAPSRLEILADKPPTGSPPRPKPSRRETSPLPVPPSPTKQIFKYESMTPPTKRPGSSSSTRRPGSSSSSSPPVSSQAQALAAQSFRPRTPIRNSPSPNTMSSAARPRTPNKSQTGPATAQLQSTAPSAYTASLGRTATPPQATKPSLKRNSLNDLKIAPSHSPKTPPASSGDHSNGSIQEHKSLDQRRASTNTLGELKIPARIFKAQQGLRRDLGLVREFAGYVEQLKRLQSTYMKLIEALCVAYDSYPVQHVTSRPHSQMGLVRKGLTANSNASTQSIQQVPLQHPISMLLNSPTKAHVTRSFSRAPGDLNRELSRLEQDYGLWWECAELLVELGGGSSSMVTAASSNPNLTTHSSSSALSTNTTYDDPPPAISKRHSRAGAHTPSMSDPGAVFGGLISPDSSKVLLEASPPQNYSRSSTGRHDLSARQLRLLRDMLNTPDPSTLPDNPAYTNMSASSSSHPYLSANPQTWDRKNPSALTLRSDESSAEHLGDITIERTKEKKRRLGIIDFLRAVKKAAIAEGRLAPRSESSLSSHTDADDDHYNRRGSPWHQHEICHAREQMPHPVSKIPSRPSLAAIFRIGGKDKNSKVLKNEGPIKGKTQYSHNDRKVSAESSGVGDADDEHGDCDEWERMSQSEVDLTNISLGMGTVRGRKSNKRPSVHPYPDYDATTPKKASAGSRTSLLDTTTIPTSIPSDLTSKQSIHKYRTSSWSQTHLISKSSAGKTPISGTVRSAPPADLNPLPDPKLTLSPENIKPLLEYAKEVSTRLNDCIVEVQSLLGQSL